MPNYEFVCNACKKTFTKTLTVAEHDVEKPSVRTAAVTRLTNVGQPSQLSPRKRVPEHSHTGEARMLSRDELGHTPLVHRGKIPLEVPPACDRHRRILPFASHEGSET
jgi:hypothetical protein